MEKDIIITLEAKDIKRVIFKCGEEECYVDLYPASREGILSECHAFHLENYHIEGHGVLVHSGNRSACIVYKIPPILIKTVNDKNEVSLY